MKDKLACFVSSRNTIQMAKMFVRTKVAPAFVEYNNLVKEFKDAISECENEKCGEHAEGVQEIYTKKMNEYSIRKDVENSKIIAGFGNFIPDDKKLEKIGEKVKNAIYLSSKHGWY